MALKMPDWGAMPADEVARKLDGLPPALQRKILRIRENQQLKAKLDADSQPHTGGSRKRCFDSAKG